MQGQRAGDEHRRRREVAHDELVALLGDLRRGCDVDHKRHAALLADLRDGDGLAGIEGADQDMASRVDRLLGLGAGDVRLGLGIVVHNVELHRQLHVGEHVVRHIGAALAGLADLRLQAGGRQQQADLQVGRRTLGEGFAQRERGAEQGSARKSSLAEATAGEVAAGHCGSSLWILLGRTIEAVPGAC